MVLSAKENKQSLPPLVFSFFDPVKETYVTLRSDEIPLQIDGGAAAQQRRRRTAAPAAPSNAPPPAPRPPPPQPADDILPQLDDRTAATHFPAALRAACRSGSRSSCRSLLLLGFAGWKWRQARAERSRSARMTRLQQEAAELQRNLRARMATARRNIWREASRAVQLKTALVNNVNANTVDAETAAAAFRLDEERATRVCNVFSRSSDELRYSGGRNGNDALSAEQRRDILELVENLRV